MFKSDLAISKKFNNFSIVTTVYPKYYCTQLSVPKTAVEKFSFSDHKIEKVKFLTQNSIKIFRSSVFNAGVGLAGCLTFRPFLTLNP